MAKQPPRQFISFYDELVKITDETSLKKFIHYLVMMPPIFGGREFCVYFPYIETVHKWEIILLKSAEDWNQDIIDDLISQFMNELSPLVKSCADEDLHQLRTMPYQEYLQSGHWLNIREKARKKAKHRCELCFSKGLIHVHHKTYKRRGCENLSDLIVLCESCHSRHHGILPNKSEDDR